MSVTTIEDLRARSVRASNGTCWLWQGSKFKGKPRIWAFSHDRGRKMALTGPAAVQNIAFDRGTQGKLPFMRCGHADCVNPVHLSLAPDMSSLLKALKACGYKIGGSSPEALMANLQKAWGENRKGRWTPPETVLAVRAAPAGTTHQALADQYGLARSTVTYLRLGKSHREIMEPTA